MLHGNCSQIFFIWGLSKISASFQAICCWPLGSSWTRENHRLNINYTDVGSCKHCLGLIFWLCYTGETLQISWRLIKFILTVLSGNVSSLELSNAVYAQCFLSCLNGFLNQYLFHFKIEHKKTIMQLSLLATG